jgi:hypothetical protein
MIGYRVCDVVILVIGVTGDVSHPDASAFADITIIRVHHKVLKVQ